MNEDKLINAGNGIIYTDDYSEFRKLAMESYSEKDNELINKLLLSINGKLWKQKQN